MYDRGHRRIGFILGLPEIQCSHDRYDGYCKALSDAGIPLDPSLVLAGNYQCEGGYTCARQFFAMPEPPTAIFASNDLTAYGVLEAADEQGIHNILLPTTLTVRKSCGAAKTVSVPSSEPSPFS